MSIFKKSEQGAQEVGVFSQDCKCLFIYMYSFLTFICNTNTLSGLFKKKKLFILYVKK